MTTFYRLPLTDFTHTKHEFSIATCAVIVSKTSKKILLHKDTLSSKWKFIGGRYEDSETFRENVISQWSEIIGDNTTITLLDPEHPIVLLDTIDIEWYDVETLLIHYAANIADEENIGDCKWFSVEEIFLLDAKNETTSANIRIVTEKVLWDTRHHIDAGHFVDPSGHNWSPMHL